MAGSSEPDVVGMTCDEMVMANQKFDGTLGS